MWRIVSPSTMGQKGSERVLSDNAMEALFTQKWDLALQRPLLSMTYPSWCVAVDQLDSFARSDYHGQTYLV